MSSILPGGTFDWFDIAFCTRLTQTLLHFLWQGCAIGLIAAALLVCLQRKSANLRYWVGVFALLAMFACLPLTYLLLPSTELATTEELPAIAQTPPGPLDSGSFIEPVSEMPAEVPPVVEQTVA